MYIPAVKTTCPIRWQAIYHPDAIAMCSDYEKISYSALDQRLLDLQKQLQQQVNNKSEPIRLVCIGANSLALLQLQLICLRLGWMFCPINPRFSESEIEQRLQVLCSDYCWVCPDTAKQHRNFNTLVIKTNEANIAQHKALTEIAIDPLTPCNIIFTSGSTGLPKAIVHHYQNHYFSAIGSTKLISLQAGDHNLLSLPLFHIGGYATVIRTFLAGACLHLSQQPLCLTLLQERKITHLSLVNTQLTRLLDNQHFQQKNCAIKHILLGGSAFSTDLLTQLRDRLFHYHLSYGCTEMSSQVATSTDSEQLQILPHREIKIVDRQIYLRGKTRFVGYYQNNQLQLIDEKEWIASGDLGSIEGEYLSISGRKDRQFISGGENIQPEEIERVCYQHPSVKQAYVMPINNSVYGQRIALFIDLDNKENKPFSVQVEQLQHFLSKQLTRFKQPDKYLAWPKQPESGQRIKIPKQIFEKQLKALGLL